MKIICFDFEGTLGPEVWLELAEKTGIPELKRTTADEPDYSKLMHGRIEILKEHSITISDIRDIVSQGSLLPGAKDFFESVKSLGFMPIILTDSFYDYILPLTAKLGDPTVFAHSLEVDESGYITSFKIRLKNQKAEAVKRLKELNFTVAAVGDSFNDIPMLKEADNGFLIYANNSVCSSCPSIRSFNDYSSLLRALEEL